MVYSRLFWQHFLSYVGVIAGATLFVSYFLDHRSDFFVDQALRQAKSETTAVFEPAAKGLFTKDPETIKKSQADLTTMAANLGGWVAVVDISGHVRFHSPLPAKLNLEEPLAWPEFREARSQGLGYGLRQLTATTSSAITVKVFLNRPEPGFYLMLVAPQPAATGEFIDLKLVLTFGGILGIILSLSVAFYLARRVTRPIAALANMTAAMSQGNYEARPENLPNNEIGKLGQTIIALSERVSANIKKREKLEKIRRNFSTNIAHELKTPLTSIRGYVETLLEGALQDPRVAERFLAIIQTNVARLISLVTDLLRLASIEAEEGQTELSPIYWQDVMDDVLDRHRPAARAKNITIQCESAPQVPAVMGNVHAMNHIFDNLMQNAISYTDEAGTITISQAWSQDRKFMVFTVQDTGIGISPKNQGRIFERFFRVDRDRSRQSGGTGLGLAIVKHLVITIGGRIELESRMGQGSSFKVYLKPAPST